MSHHSSKPQQWQWTWRKTPTEPLGSMKTKTRLTFKTTKLPWLVVEHHNEERYRYDFFIKTFYCFIVFFLLASFLRVIYKLFSFSSFFDWLGTVMGPGQCSQTAGCLCLLLQFKVLRLQGVKSVTTRTFSHSFLVFRF